MPTQNMAETECIATDCSHRSTKSRAYSFNTHFILVPFNGPDIVALGHIWAD